MLWSPILHRRGCPIRRSTDIVLIYSSPWLIAVSRVLRRLLMPRHSPYALLCLNFYFFSYLLLWVSQIIFVLQWKSFFRCFLWSSAIFWRLNCSFLPDFFLRKTWFQNLKKIICSFQYLYSVFNDLSFFAILHHCSLLLYGWRHCRPGGLKWTRTTDLVLIRHAL